MSVLESSARVLRARVDAVALSVTEHEELVRDPRCGAVVSFAGIVRDHDHDRGVRMLTYVAHPSAAQVLTDLAASAVQGAADVGDLRIAVSHRVGDLVVGDVALVCAVATPHRRDAFIHCGELVERVKASLPIWKHQVFADGAEEWVDCP